jgi:hypothetical protein
MKPLPPLPGRVAKGDVDIGIVRETAFGKFHPICPHIGIARGHDDPFVGAHRTRVRRVVEPNPH